ncbi:MAG TPA: hypothetical protein VHV27_06720 [Phenylobacterium sp.]|jgi:hypothetical protein|nr:hypothetical protein [Phenylobacterium sp.]
MRVLLALAAAAAVAGPAFAQRPPPPTPFTAPGAGALESTFQVQQEAARQAAIQQQGQLTALQAQLRMQQSLLDLQAATNGPVIPPPNLANGPPYPQIDTSQLGSIPDAVLADSNKRVLDAAGHQP